ncbi:MAG: hypothetical protein JZU65_02635 [Chlorobium sp.]|nr:hypothetical protein [Chlorobium sp.]
MYDPSSNKFYYEDADNHSPETFEKINLALKDSIRRKLSEEDSIQNYTEAGRSALSNCVTVSKHIDITLMSNAIDGINKILSDLDIAANRLVEMPVQNDNYKPETPIKSPKDEIGYYDINELIYELVDGARDDLFAVRQAVVDLCAE